MSAVMSGIVTKERSIFFHPSSDQHEDIIDRHNLIDDKAGKDRLILRFEILPQVSLESYNPRHWAFSVKGSVPNLPDWYNRSSIDIKKLCVDSAMLLIQRGRYLDWGGDLYLPYTKIKNLPENLKVKRTLFLYGAELENLPDNLYVGKTLNLRSSKMKELPCTLEVGDNLILVDTKVKHFPVSIRIGGDIVI